MKARLNFYDSVRLFCDLAVLVLVVAAIIGIAGYGFAQVSIWLLQ